MRSGGGSGLSLDDYYVSSTPKAGKFDQSLNSTFDLSTVISSDSPVVFGSGRLSRNSTLQNDGSSVGVDDDSSDEEVRLETARRTARLNVKQLVDKFGGKI